MRPNLQHQAIYDRQLYDFVPIAWPLKIRHNYMFEFMPYILQISKTSLFICASLNQTAKLGLFDDWSWEKYLSWNISNYWSMVHNIPEEQTFYYHFGSSPISCLVLLVISLTLRFARLTSVNSNHISAPSVSFKGPDFTKYGENVLLSRRVINNSNKYNRYGIIHIKLQDSGLLS